MTVTYDQLKAKSIPVLARAALDESLDIRERVNHYEMLVVAVNEGHTDWAVLSEAQRQEVKRACDLDLSHALEDVNGPA